MQSNQEVVVLDKQDLGLEVSDHILWYGAAAAEWSAPNHWATCLREVEHRLAKPLRAVFSIACMGVGGCSHTWLGWRCKSHSAIGF